MNRRQVLALASGVGFGAVAGCLGSDESYATLEGITLVNLLDEPATTELRIERLDTGEVVHESSYEVPYDPEGFDGKPVECVWPDEPLRVMARRAGDDEWQTFDTAAYDGCAGLLLETNESSLSIFSSVLECPHPVRECHATGAD